MNQNLKYCKWLTSYHWMQTGPVFRRSRTDVPFSDKTLIELCEYQTKRKSDGPTGPRFTPHNSAMWLPPNLTALRLKMLQILIMKNIPVTLWITEMKVVESGPALCSCAASHPQFHPSELWTPWNRYSDNKYKSGSPKWAPVFDRVN